ncbi:AAA family ATPase [Rhodocista pekingensis]|uniref:AAA family ATPase n=1 Tax=Rhodocista pekingensis TaxID=201185 RepID=A0ABW2KRD1_9PROT
MRIDRLVLERYGHFEDRELDLSGSDVLLHVVHGPNEAGKSTTLQAIYDLLFGFGHTTDYAFRHDTGSLRIGATLVNRDGRSFAFRRRKGRGDTILSADGTALPEAVLAPFLGGTTREEFERLFGLDHRRLREGGDAMLDARGDIGRSLFEAGSGTAGLSAVAEALKAAADEIGAPNARASAKKPYFAALARFEEAQRRCRNDGLRTEDWTKAVRAAEEAQARRDRIATDLSALQAERNRIERLCRVLPLLRRLEALEALLGTLGDGPDLDDGFEAEWRQALETQRARADQFRARRENRDAAKAALDALGGIGPWAQHEKTINDLVSGLGEYRSFMESIPNRKRDLAAGGERIADLLRRLGLPGRDPGSVATLMPDAATVARIQTLRTGRTTLDADHRNAAEELREAERRTARATAALEAAGTPADPADLEAGFERLREMGDVWAPLREADAALDLARRELADALLAVGRGGWQPEALLALPVPSVESLHQFEARRSALTRRRDELEETRARLQAELDGIALDLRTLRADGEVPTEAAVAAARERRDTGWRLIRRRHVEGAPVAAEEIDAFRAGTPLADAYEATVRHADGLVDRKEREAARVERDRQLRGRLERTEAELRKATAAVTEAGDALAAWTAEWEAAWRPAGLSPGSPDDMKGWLERRQAAVERLGAVRRAEAALATRRGAEEALRRGLLALADRLSLPDAGRLTTPELRDAVKAAVGRAKAAWTEAAAARKALADARTEETERRGALEAVQRRLADWMARWAEAAPRLGLSPAATAEEAEAALALWQQVALEEKGQAEQRHRRDQMQEATDAYRARVAALLRDLGGAAGDIDPAADPTELVPLIQKRLAENRDLGIRIAEARSRLATAEDEAGKAELAARDADDAVVALRERHGLDAALDVIAATRAAAERRRLRREIADLAGRLLEAGDGLDGAMLRAEAATVDLDAAMAERQRLEPEITRLQAELEAAVQELATARAEQRTLEKSEGAADAAGEMNNAAAEIGALVEQWLRTRTAGILLNRAIERYRRENEHPLISRASAIFAAVAGTGDDPIVRLSVDYADEAHPVPIAHRRDGRRVPVTGLSEGTRDQLYLALRIASVERYIENREPLPFIADDLFITSDEERTAPGIRALAELGRRTQVILFTHHRYVVEAAQDAVPARQLRVHSLAPQSLLQPA